MCRLVGQVTSYVMAIGLSLAGRAMPAIEGANATD